VDSYQDELATIKAILKANPKGMTVTDIARETHTNRNSIAKYLDILLITGHVDLLTFGPAKVYFPSTRLPVSTLIDVSADSILLLNKDLTIIQTNTTLLTLLGTTRNTLIGQPITTLADTLNLPELATTAHHALTGTETTLDRPYTHHNTPLTLQIRALPTTFDDGQPGVTLILTDTTTTHRLKDQLTAATTFWQTTADALTDLIFLMDADYTITRLNTATVTYLGLPPDSCIGRKCYELIHHTTQPAPTCLCPEIKTTKKPGTETFYDHTKDRHLDVLAVPLFTPTGDFNGAIHIVKERKPTQKN